MKLITTLPRRKRSSANTALLRALALPVESLEDRVLLSIASATFAPPTVSGDQWTYQVTVAPMLLANGQMSSGSVSTLIQTVIGAAVYNGNSGIETDSGSVSMPSALKSYTGLDAQGDSVGFGNIETGTHVTQTTTYTPYQPGLPVQIAQGTGYTNNYTATETSTLNATGAVTSATTDADTEVIGILSETPASLTVPAGTYSTYHVTDFSTIASPNGDGTNTTTHSMTDSWLAPNVGLVQSITGTVTTVLVSFRNINDKLAFIQQPSNTAVNGTIKPPVTVEVEDATGAYQTDATGSVTIALAPGSTGTGKLDGTLTEPVVGGIATFSDLTIDTGGDYLLTATDTATPPIAPAMSEPFKITDKMLAFETPPVDGTANDPLPPIIVNLTDAMGNVDTTDNSTVITLAPIGFTSANPIKNNTATVVNGVATFNNAILTKPGFYQLQATDAAGDANATSDKFKVAGDKLMFLLQPKPTDINTPIPLTVEILNNAGKVDKTATTSLVLSLNTVSGGVGAKFLGTTTLAFVAGIAKFTAANGPKIDTAGTYTLTATEEDFSTGVLAATNTTSAITTMPFAVAGYLLKIKQQPPGSVDVLKPITLSVSLVDHHGRPDSTENTAQVQLSLQTVTGGTGAILSGTTTVTFKNGIATFSSTAGPSINSVGTFKLVANEIGSTAPATQVSTDSFKTVGYHFDIEFTLHERVGLDVVKEDRLIALNDDVPMGQQFFSVFLLDKNNKPVSGTLPNLMITATAISGDGQLLSDPIATSTRDSNYSVFCDMSSAGVYDFTLSAVGSGSAIPAAAVAPLVVKSRKVYDAALRGGPFFGKTYVAQQAITSPFNLSTPNAFRPNAWIIKASQSAGISITLTGSSGHGVIVGDQVYSLTSNNPLQITEPGNYVLTCTLVVTPGGLPFDSSNYAPSAVTPPLVIHLKILSDKVVFVQQPPFTAAVGQSFTVSVELADSSGNPISDFVDSPDDEGFVVVIVLTSRASFTGGVNDLQNASPMLITNGMAVFANLSFSMAGTHALHASEMLLDESTGALQSIFGSTDAISSLSHVGS